MEKNNVYNYMESLKSLGSVPGLETITELMYRLGNPQNSLKVIHIAGTNGKGSVGTFIENILINAGYITGRYSSPAVMSPLEIIRICGKDINEEDFSECIFAVEDVCLDMEKDGFIHPTLFEVETAAAMYFFNKINIDVAIIECGMGGLYDATNIFNTVLCSVITSISVDHTAFLGNSIEEITLHKAGIIKYGCKTVTSNKDKAVMDVLMCEAENKASVLINTRPVSNLHINSNYELIFSYGSYHDLKSGLCGLYQADNASLAIEAVLASGLKCSENNIREGISNAVWNGRFEIIRHNPVFIIDGAHNPNGAEALFNTVNFLFKDRKFTFLIGIFKDKDIYGILDRIMNIADNVVVIPANDNNRTADIRVLSYNIRKRYGIKSVWFEDINTALRYCMDITHPDSGILSFGSLSNISIIKDEVDIIDNRR